MAGINLGVVNMHRNDLFLHSLTHFLSGLFLGSVQEHILLVDELSPCVFTKIPRVPFTL